MKAMTYNIKNGGQDDLDYGRLDSVLEVIVAESPNILVLQEMMYADLFGNRMLHRLENETGMHAFLAHARTGQHVAVLVSKAGRVLTSVMTMKTWSLAASHGGFAMGTVQ